MLTSAQIVTLRAAILAETDPQVVQWRTPATRDDNSLTVWLNGTSSTLAWKKEADALALDDAPDYSTYDTLAAGKRDSWALFREYPRDFGRNKVRKWITDVWGNATAGSNSEAILQAGTEFARRAEVYLGGSSKTTGTVSALDRSFVGEVDIDDVSAALNGA